jgi:glycosyltransferase involved in cell wall biosynthesis
MRIALIAAPFIPVPPKAYGGTELFIAQLADGLKKLNFEVVVYCNGESTINTERRWLYKKSLWPVKGGIYDNLPDLNHTGWAVKDASRSCDVIHLNNLPGLVHSRFIDNAMVYTIHHAYEEELAAFYDYYPDVNYVAISGFQARRYRFPNIRTIHHGIELSKYKLQEKKQHYLSFLGRIAPMKGVHLAIEAAKKAGIPLKIAGEVQPVFRDYFESKVKPHIDGKFIEFIGPADLTVKNELLGNSMAMLFPVLWDEPFGLVMIEAMACGTPVLAFNGGSVEEVISRSECGHICGSVEEMAKRARTAIEDYAPAKIVAYVAKHFSVDHMVGQYAQLYREIAHGILVGAETGQQRAVA